MMPALFMRTSSRSDLEVNVLAAEATDSKEERSSGMNVMAALGWSFLSSSTAASPLLGVREAR